MQIRFTFINISSYFGCVILVLWPYYEKILPKHRVIVV